MRLLSLAVVLVVSGCGSAPCRGRSDAPSARLPPDVYIIDAKYMRAMCTVVDEDGTQQLYAGEPCPNYRTPPTALVAHFEARLPELLKAKGHDLVAHEYVRQYWAVFRDGQLHIVGNFACRSDIEPTPTEQLAQTPILIDDGGECAVTATFPADRPEAVEFHHD